MTKRVLIVSPGFHGYYAAIARAFGELGYDVATVRYDAAATNKEKVWRKVRHELPSRLRGHDAHLSSEVVSQRTIQSLREAAPDLVLVVRGDVLTEEFWAEASRGGRPVAVWMYDEIRRTTFDPAMVAPHARLATYSAHDAEDLRGRGFDALHVPLGFDTTGGVSDTQLGTGEITFVGAPSPKRLGALRALQDHGMPVAAWGRGWSDHWVDRARTWRLASLGVPAGRDLPSEMTHAVMRNSAATLNIHGDQDGFTMRTFEAAGVGAVQLIDRDDVTEFYEPGREVLVFRDEAELLDLGRQVLASPRDFAELRSRARRRTLAEHTLRHRAQTLETLW